MVIEVFFRDLIVISVDVPEWLAWGNWSECTTSCGLGSKMRGRLCSHQPINGSEQCDGNAFEFDNCTVAECPGETLHLQIRQFTSKNSFIS